MGSARPLEAPEIVKLLRPEREALTESGPSPGGVDKSTKRVAQAMFVSLLLGLLVTAVGAWNKSAQALLWALACSGVGWFPGFLFGIPRSLASGQAAAAKATPDKAAADKAAADKAAAVAHTSTIGVNTNLRLALEK